MRRGTGGNSDGGSPGKRPHLPQAAVVPICRGKDVVSVCLVTSLKKKSWILPKGIVDPGETPAQAALKEAFEEAGLKGRIVGDPLGSFQDSKWGATVDVTVFLMEVDACMDRWGESHMRQRHFAPLAEAHKLVKKPALRRMLRKARKRLGGGEEGSDGQD